MKKDVWNIKIIIGVILKTNSMKLLFILLIINAFSCKSQGVESRSVSVLDTLTEEKVYLLVNEMPEFLGEDGNILNYIYKNFKDSTMIGVQISLRLRFVIDTQGNLIGVGLTNKSKSQYNEEETKIIDIVKNSPKWKPGKYLKKQISALMTIKFSGVINESGRLDRIWTTGFLYPHVINEK